MNRPLLLLMALLPAVFLGGGALVTALIAAVRPRTHPSLYRGVGMLAAAASITASIRELLAISPERSGVGLVDLSGGFVVDRFHVFGSILCAAILMAALLGSEAYIRRAPSRAGAFCSLLQVATGGAVMLLASREVTAFTAAMGLLVTSLVLLTALTKRSAVSAEAALRQLLWGGAALATSVYGLVLIDVATGSTDLQQLAAAVRTDGAPISPVLSSTGIVLVVTGLTMLLGAPPFQLWSRSSVEGAPAPVAAFGSALAAVTGAMVLARFSVEGFGTGNPRWSLVATTLSALAILVGGVLSLRASTLRRLIADLTMSQAGFLLLSLVASGRGLDGSILGGPTALLYTLMGAAAATVGALLLAGILDNAGLADSWEDHRGLGRRAPATAGWLSLALLGLAGAPPLVGFVGRVLIAQSALDAGAGWVVAIAGVGMTLVLAAVVRRLALMYGEPTDASPFSVGSTPLLGRATAWTAAALGLLLAALAGPLVSIAGGGATSLH